MLPYIFEIDCYLPELKIGFEYDGDYWHSLPEMIKRDKKKNACARKAGIHLYHIKENEWLNNKESSKVKVYNIIMKGV